MSKRLTVAAGTGLVLALACPTTENFGRFVGTVKTEWIDPDRKMRLLDDFVYVDSVGVDWRAPKSSVIDGASIPRLLWTLVGSPFTGKYRNASVVHDVACDARLRPWEAVHRMFYEACRCGGVDEQMAKVLYAGVYHFGPRWAPSGAALTEPRPLATAEQFEQLKSYVESSNPSLRAIEGFVPREERLVHPALTPPPPV